MEELTLTRFVPAGAGMTALLPWQGWTLNAEWMRFLQKVMPNKIILIERAALHCGGDIGQSFG